MYIDISEGLAICMVNVQEPLKFGHINFSVEIIEIMFVCVCEILIITNMATVLMFYGMMRGLN
jgi:hypothetical protein